MARSLNPVLKGWWQYYGRFYPTEMGKLFVYFDERLGAGCVRSTSSTKAIARAACGG
ncbi:group II intron maturase-specific domain-containing protein [Brucella oryzae]|uniref:group II intron maturase-specific domain-containing protein n=1 Tax=Brucella oryzae TaxID=335286 RepID=UPI0031FD6140